MPKTFSKSETIQISVRLPLKTSSYLKKRAEQTPNGTVADAIREAVEAMYMFYGLPDRMAEALREDAKSLGKDEPGYVRELLAKRYEEVLLERGKGGKK